MDDLIEKLRDRGEWSDGGKVWEQDALCAHAANELERLTKALELIAGSATNKLQALHAKAALDNIG